MTGNDLLDPNQSFFTYSGVALSFERAEEIVRKILHDYSIQGGELKGKNLTKTVQGRSAIGAVIKEVASDAHVVFFHKKYALACKFFEYIFEPVLARQNNIFYEAGFHRFISNLLYFWTEAREESAGQLLTEFAAYMRSLDPSRVPTLFGNQSLIVQTNADPISHIATFCTIHRSKIAEEVAEMGGTATGKWILDLTSSSLFSILSYWGDVYNQLDVYCDDSKPLQANQMFDAMIDRADRAYISFGGRERLMTFNLTRSPHLVRSSDYFGVQIADVLASSLRYALEHRNDADAQAWLVDLAPSISGESVVPDTTTVDPNTSEAFVNSAILNELVERSLRKEDLFDGIPQLIAFARSAFPEFQSLQANPSLLHE